VKHRTLFLVLLPAAAALGQTPAKVLVAVGNPVMKTLVSPGALACVGGTPTGLWPQMPPCSPGTTRILFSYRNALFDTRQVSGSAGSLISGTMNVVTHCNLDATGYGHCWGHFEWDVPGSGGIWEGSWSGMWDGATNSTSYGGTGYGYGGKLDGLRVEFQCADTGLDKPTALIATVSGI